MLAARLRAAVPGDMAAVADLYAEHVRAGFGTFEEVAPGPEEMDRRRAEVARLGLPYLVLDDGVGILGFAYASPFRSRSAYRYVAEDSVYVARDRGGRGHGAALLGGVVDACAALGLRQMIAVIGDSENAASIRLHARMGFSRCGVIASIGYKAGRWVDVVVMQRALNGGDGAPPLDPGLAI